MKRPNLLLATLALAVAGNSVACNRGGGDEEAPAGDEETVSAEIPADAISCELTGAIELIDNIRLNDADGECKLFLPIGVSPGTYEIRVSAAGSNDAAAVERRIEGGILYASFGTVEITEAGDRLIGTAYAVDDGPPVTGTVAFEFDVAMPE
ncbi:MAG: hypothetical protein ACJAYU_005250 [Bradymonadia bacterium]|jgi:hypothetical protein